jgi:hypothetical protein
MFSSADAFEDFQELLAQKMKEHGPQDGWD